MSIDNVMDDLDGQIPRLTARIKRLEEALEPLIHELSVREAYKEPEKIDSLSRLPIRVLDLRRARAAYKDEPDA